MSKIEVDTVEPQSGTSLTLGASGDTITIPAGATLANNGTATGFASIAWQSSIVTAATLTAVSGNGYWINTTSNACTITLPASASAGDTIVFVDYTRTWGTNAVTINQNSLNFQGNTSPNPIYNTNGQSVTITYSGATQGWIPTVDDDVTNEVPQPYSVDFLVIAGGGGGGSSGGDADRIGGGGAGGYRTSTQTVSVGTEITVTVGDGGATNTNGSDSSISGSGLTTITSAGGGAGSSTSADGSSGGSGGGGGGAFASTGTSSGGAGNTPSTSPSQGNNGGGGYHTPGIDAGGGGGGGAGGVGVTAGPSPIAVPNGGVGSASSITGSSVTRAGGGGGRQANSSNGTGGTGGGGNGGSSPTAGTANTGGGGGGGNSGASGGKGVIILSMPDASYSGTTTGSPTVATGVSGNTVLTFTGTGSYTA